MYQDPSLDHLSPRLRAEHQFLGVIFRGNVKDGDAYLNPVMDEVMEKLPDYQFEDQELGQIFEHLKGAWGKKIALDSFFVMTYPKTNALKVATIEQATAVTLSHRQVMDLIYQFSKEDRLKAAIVKMVSKIRSGSTDVSSDLSSMAEIIQPRDSSLRSEFQSEDETLDIVEKTLAGELEPRFNFGWKFFDQTTNGIGRGDLVILAARPSVGKTAISLNLLKIASDKKYRSLYFSLEMPHHSIMSRLFAMRAKIDSKKLFSGDLNEGELDRVINLIRKRPEKPTLYIADNHKTDITTIRAQTAQAAARMGGIDFVFVDYIGLIKTTGKSQNREREVAELSSALKQLAREHNCAVVALSQLNRKVADRKDNRPLLSDLRDSGSLEQDADIVLLLHRPIMTDPNADPTLAEVIVAKNRNGEVGILKFDFAKQIMKFDERQTQ